MSDDGLGRDAARGADTAAVAAASAREAGELILRVAHELDQMFQRATADEDLDPFEARLLAAAGRGSQTELAARLGADASRISIVTAQLEHRGLLRREPSRGDRRVRVAAPTPAGAAAVERIGRRLEAASPLLSRLDEDQRRALIDLLQLLTRPSA